MASPVRFAVVGVGVIGKLHARGIKAASGAELAAVVDVDPLARDLAAAEHGVPAFTTVDELAAADVADAITVGVPSGTHAIVGISAARHGLHVLCEKPIDVSIRAAKDLIAACRQNGVKLACVSQSRFDPDIQATRAAVQEGRLGRMVLADACTKWYRSQQYYDAGGWRGTWAQDGGGALMNQSIHAIDIMQWIMGPVLTVCGFAGTLAHRMETEDTGVGILRFESGALGVIEGATSLGKGQARRHEFHGTVGSIIMEEGKVVVWNLGDGSQPPSATESSAVQAVATDPAAVGHLGHKRHVEDLVAAIREDRDPFITGEQAMKPMELILAIYESNRRGGEAIKLPLPG